MPTTNPVPSTSSSKLNPEAAPFVPFASRPRPQPVDAQPSPVRARQADGDNTRAAITGATFMRQVLEQLEAKAPHSPQLNVQVNSPVDPARNADSPLNVDAEALIPGTSQSASASPRGETEASASDAFQSTGSLAVAGSPALSPVPPQRSASVRPTIPVDLAAITLSTRGSQRQQKALRASLRSASGSVADTAKTDTSEARRHEDGASRDSFYRSFDMEQAGRPVSMQPSGSAPETAPFVRSATAPGAVRRSENTPHKNLEKMIDSGEVPRVPGGWAIIFVNQGLLKTQLDVLTDTEKLNLSIFISNIKKGEHPATAAKFGASHYEKMGNKSGSQGTFSIKLSGDSRVYFDQHKGANTIVIRSIKDHI